MRYLRKILALTLALTGILALAACGSKSAGTATTVATTAPTAADTVPQTQPGEEVTEAAATESASGKTLVVYYSASSNTRRVAEAIAQAANGDIFEIVPAEVYSNADLNWTDSNSRVSREHDDESLRDVALVSTEVPNWASYDTVLLGYPIWWGIAAWPVDNFVKGNDFNGKTVIPFATSSSSGMSQSGSLLASMVGTGAWQDGQRFSSGVSDGDVQNWVQGLGL